MHSFAQLKNHIYKNDYTAAGRTFACKSRISFEVSASPFCSVSLNESIRAAGTQTYSLNATLSVKILIDQSNHLLSFDQ